MHPLLTKRIEITIPWKRVRKSLALVLEVVAIAIVVYVLTAPPIAKAVMKAQIQHTHRAHWPTFYGPLMIGLENDSPLIHGPFRWYFNSVWGCGIIFFSDNPMMPKAE